VEVVVPELKLEFDSLPLFYLQSKFQIKTSGKREKIPQWGVKLTKQEKMRVVSELIGLQF